MMSSHDFISDIRFKLQNEYGESESFNRQSPTFLLSMKGVQSLLNDKDFIEMKIYSQIEKKVTNSTSKNSPFWLFTIKYTKP